MNPHSPTQGSDQPLEGTVVASDPTGFAGGPVAGRPQAPQAAWPQQYWTHTSAVQPPVADGRRRKRWVPFALAGAGVALLLGGGVGGYAIGHATADAGTVTSQTGQLVPGTDGQFPGSDGSSGQLGTPPDVSGGFGGQFGQQGGTSGGTSEGTSGGTGATTDDGTST